MLKDPAVSKYLSNIGRKGGQKSRRTLDSETARKMAASRTIQDEFTNRPDLNHKQRYYLRRKKRLKESKDNT